MNEKIPLIGISMGDPAGIGPEIIVKSVQGKYDGCMAQNRNA